MEGSYDAGPTECCIHHWLTNASWTLGADTAAQLVCRLLRTLQSRQMIALIPRLEPKEASTLGQRKLLNINATYVAVAERGLPKAGDRGAWQPRDNYVADLRFARRGNLDDGLEFIPSPEAEGRSART